MSFTRSLSFLVLLFATSLAAAWSADYDKAVGGDKKDVHAHDKHKKRVMDKGVQEQLEYVQGQLSAFLKARDEFSTMQKQVEDRFKSDEDEIDRLVERQHRIKEDEKDSKAEAEAFRKQASMLEAEEKIYEKKNETKEAVVMKQQIAALQELSSTLQGSAAEIDEDQKDIDRITLEGKKLYAELQKRQQEQATIEAQLKILEKQQARLEEKVDDKADGRSSYAHGILDDENDMEEEGEEYEAESAAALENAIGWKQDTLEEQATNAEDALRKGIGGPGGGNMMKQIGGMMGVMHAVR